MRAVPDGKILFITTRENTIDLTSCVGYNRSQINLEYIKLVYCAVGKRITELGYFSQSYKDIFSLLYKRHVVPPGS